MKKGQLDMLKKLALALALAGMVSACDQIVTSAEQVETIESVGTVREIDRANRRMRVAADGQILTLRISQDVRNFEQIEVGDRINVGYRRAVAVEMSESATPTAPTGVGVTAVAAEGQRPGFAEIDVETRVVEFLAYNPSTHNAVIRAEDGTVAQVAVPRELRRFARQREIGDMVTVQIQHAVAVVVTPAA